MMARFAAFAPTVFFISGIISSSGMTRRLVVAPEAEADMRAAFVWYEEQRPGLGEEFLLAVEAAFATVERSPESLPVVRGQLRRAIVRRFPYGVFSIAEDDAIHVLAVLHAKRDPEVWQRRHGR